MDESLIGGKKKPGMRKELKIAVSVYMVYIVILATFILSCVGLGLTNAATIQNKMYTYKFPYLERWTGFGMVTPVSISSRGNIWPGAGTTVYRNITSAMVTSDMENVKMASCSYDMMLVVYNTGWRCYQNSYDQNIASQVGRSGTFTENIVVRNLVKLSNERYIIVAELALYPLSVHVERNEQGQIREFAVTVGYNGKLVLNGCRFPYVDSMSNSAACMTCEKDRNVTAYYLTWSSNTLKASEPVIIGQVYGYHGVSGMTDEYFIAVGGGAARNTTHEWPLIESQLMRIQGGKPVKVNDWVRLPWVLSSGWLRTDNFNNNTALLTYCDMTTNGIEAVLIHMKTNDKDEKSIVYGSSITVQSGGAVYQGSRMEMRIFDSYTFGIIYEDAAHFGVKLMMGAISGTNDLVTNGPVMTISEAFVREPPSFGNDPNPPARPGFYFDMCEFGWSGDFAIVEFENFGPLRQSMIHRGDVRARPFGIATGTRGSSVSIQFHGTIKVAGAKFKPGYAYYTDSRARIRQGPAYGFANRDWGVGAIYYRNSAGYVSEIILTRNILGVAVASNKLKLMIDKA